MSLDWEDKACDTYWGSHGCALDSGHKGPCVCDDRDIGEDGLPIGDIFLDNDVPGVPPYYGPDTNFFSLFDTPTPPQTLKAAHNARRTDA